MSAGIVVIVTSVIFGLIMLCFTSFACGYLSVNRKPFILRIIPLSLFFLGLNALVSVLFVTGVAFIAGIVFCLVWLLLALRNATRAVR